ncbi:hypothetical protein L6164_013075 [Bauhinia variegata]|uniref:Uncharacterized protein n=1 Tax=Bauhinia variegata TaxID=167791 RepID=A0ACB9PD77_BAUVA|nr:hypothetical protein L6164_013075 [Bauhinia variegata]
MVSYDSPTAGIWYIKGRYLLMKGKNVKLIINLQDGKKSPKSNQRGSRWYGNLNKEDTPFIYAETDRRPGGACQLIAPPVLSSLYGNLQEKPKNVMNQEKQASAFESFVPKKANINPPATHASASTK